MHPPNWSELCLSSVLSDTWRPDKLWKFLFSCLPCDLFEVQSCSCPVDIVAARVFYITSGESVPLRWLPSPDFWPMILHFIFYPMLLWQEHLSYWDARLYRWLHAILLIYFISSWFACCASCNQLMVGIKEGNGCALEKFKASSWSDTRS